MAENASPKDQIAFISNPYIKKDFFGKFFMVDGIDFLHHPDKCNDLLWERMQQMSNTPSQNKLYARLCTIMNTIDLFGSHPKQLAETIDHIKTRADLYDAYRLCPDFDPKNNTARDIAAWIYLRSVHITHDAIQQQAAIVWNIIESQIATLQQQTKTYTFFLDPFSGYPDNLSQLFEAEYLKMRRKETQNEKYAAQCVHDRLTNCERFSITTEKDRVLALLKNNDGAKPFKVDDDPTAETFSLHFYPIHQYIVIKSYGNRNRCYKLATIFAQLCGTTLTNRKGKKCYIQHFAHRAALASLTLNDDSGKHRVWISALGVIRKNQAGEDVAKTIELEFPFSQSRTIYDNVENQYPETEQQLSISDVFKIELSFQFTDYTERGNHKLYHDTPLSPIKVTIEPNNCNDRQATKNLRPEYRNMVEECLKSAHIYPVSNDEFNQLSHML